MPSQTCQILICLAWCVFLRFVMVWNDSSSRVYFSYFSEDFRQTYVCVPFSFDPLKAWLQLELKQTMHTGGCYTFKLQDNPENLWLSCVLIKTHTRVGALVSTWPVSPKKHETFCFVLFRERANFIGRLIFTFMFITNDPRLNIFWILPLNISLHQSRRVLCTLFKLCRIQSEKIFYD